MTVMIYLLPRTLWQSSVSFGFVRFIRTLSGGNLILSGGSFGFVGFIRGRHGGRRVHSGSFCYFPCVLGVVGFIGVRWVGSDAPSAYRLIGARSWVVGFIGCTLVSLGSFRRALGIVGFIRVCCVYSVPPYGSSARSLGSFMRALAVVGFI